MASLRLSERKQFAVIRWLWDQGYSWWDWSCTEFDANQIANQDPAYQNIALMSGMGLEEY